MSDGILLKCALVAAEKISYLSPKINIKSGFKLKKHLLNFLIPSAK